MEQSSFVQILHSRKFWALVIALVAIMAGYGTGGLDAWQAIQALVAALAAYSTGVAIEDAGFKAGANRPAGPPVYVLPASPVVVELPEEQVVSRVSMVKRESTPQVDPITTENTNPPNESTAPSVAPDGKALRQQLSRPSPRVKWEG